MKSFLDLKLEGQIVSVLELKPIFFQIEYTILKNARLLFDHGLIFLVKIHFGFQWFGSTGDLDTDHFHSPCRFVTALYFFFRPSSLLAAEFVAPRRVKMWTKLTGRAAHWASQWGATTTKRIDCTFFAPFLVGSLSSQFEARR